MLFSLRLHASIALISFAFFTNATHAEKLRVTSTPPGAKVEINGVAVGTTPFEKDYPGGYFHKTNTAVGLAPRSPIRSIKPPLWRSLNTGGCISLRVQINRNFLHK